MHQKAKEKILAKVVGALKNSEVSEGWLVFESYSDNVFTIGKEVLKHKKEWLTLTNVYSIFSDYAQQGIKAKFEKREEVAGNYQELLGEEELLHIAEDMTSHISGVPYDYDFFIPLPSFGFDDFEIIPLGKGLSLVRTEEKEEKHGLMARTILGDAEPKRKTTYLHVQSSGFAMGAVTDSAATSALSAFKQVVQVAIYRGLLKPQAEIANYLGAMGQQQYIPKNNILSRIQGEPKYRVTVLPIQLSMFLQRLVLHKENKSIQSFTENNELPNKITEILRKPTEVIGSSDKDAIPIQAALLWAFDAELNENETISFIQVCIGLESVLGDDSEAEALTSRLSDRCAYLLGSGTKSRRTIAKNFKEMYKVRSKLVHGRAVKLSTDNKYHLDWGKKILQFVVAKEISGFEP